MYVLPSYFKTSSGGPTVISNPGLPRENPVLSHWATETVLHSRTHSLTHWESPDDIVHYGLARKHKNRKEVISNLTLIQRPGN